MKKVIGSFAMLSVIALLGGCGDKKAEQGCSGEGEAFFTKSLNGYFVEHPQPNGQNGFTLQPGARYDSTNNWWIVPFDYSGGKAQALLSCDGRLEISSR